MSLKQDRKIGFGLLLVSGILFIETFTFPSRQYITLNVEFWPRVVLAMIAILGVVMVWKGQLDDNPRKLQNKAFIVGLVCLLYTVLLEPIGYLVLTPVFLFISNLVLSKDLKKRRWVEAFIIATVGTSVIYFIFHDGLLVQLPEGLLD